MTELDKQIDQYDSLSIIKSARGQSFLLLVFSSCGTTLFILLSYLDPVNFIEVFLSLLLGYFIFRGHKWAMIIAMIFWTAERFCSLYETFTNFSHSSSNDRLLNIVWWTFYMHIFYVAFNVERLRTSGNMPDKMISSEPLNSDPFAELEEIEDLKEKGVISEEEFILKRQKILRN